MAFQHTRRRFLTVTGSAALLGIVGTGNASAMADAPVPDGSSEYPTLGTSADNPTATVYGSFKCPYTNDFVESGNLDAIVEEFVETGRLNLEFRALDLDPAGGYWISENAALVGEAARGVWVEDPESYWSFFENIWSEMPDSVSLDDLAGYMGDAGVRPVDTIVSGVESGSYEGGLQSTASAADSLGIPTIPRLELDGDITNPRFDGIVDWLDARVDGTSSESTEPEPDDDPDEDSEQSDSDDDPDGASEDDSEQSDPEAESDETTDDDSHDDPVESDPGDDIVCPTDI